VAFWEEHTSDDKLRFDIFSKVLQYFFLLAIIFTLKKELNYVYHIKFSDKTGWAILCENLTVKYDEVSFYCVKCWYAA
jgi:hypothetical protein